VPSLVERYGTVQVTTVTAGSGLDPDGFVVRIDGEWDYTHEATPLAVNGTVTLRSIPAGRHTLTLLGVASNCSGEDLTDRSIVVAADSTTAVVFELVCR